MQLHIATLLFYLQFFPNGFMRIWLEFLWLIITHHYFISIFKQLHVQQCVLKLFTIKFLFADPPLGKPFTNRVLLIKGKKGEY